MSGFTLYVAGRRNWVIKHWDGALGYNGGLVENINGLRAMTTSILVIEDDRVQREIIRTILESAGYSVETRASAEAGLEALREAEYRLMLTDLRMPGMDGLELLRQAKRHRPGMAAVMMTAHATVQTAVSAMKEGATDYLEKPFDKEDLLRVIGRSLERTELRQENEALRQLVTDAVSLGNIVGQSGSMRKVFTRTERAVAVSSTVLILGASGTGKELIARHIHFSGPRRKKPFVVVNCAAIPESLVESELFGHVKGAFTGADASRSGKFEAAHGGTLFLDEIGDMPLESQAKLLRVLQDGKVQRVGGADARQVDVRTIAATNSDLRKRVADGEFRQDLFYRLEVLPIELPPLRERMDDLPLLVAHFREKLGRKLNMETPSLTPEVMEAFQRYRWPGNVRELEHSLEQLYVLSDGDAIGQEALPEKFRLRPLSEDEISLPPGGLVLEDVEQRLIQQALSKSGGRITEAAELLGLSYKTLQYRMKKHGIGRDGQGEDATLE
jgi:two-component system, NtrC family, response regulator AtoC